MVSTGKRRTRKSSRLSSRLEKIKTIAQTHLAQLAYTHHLRQSFFILPDLLLDRLLLLHEYTKSDSEDAGFYFGAEYSGLLDTEFFKDHPLDRATFIEVLVQAFKDNKPRFCERMVKHQQGDATVCGKNAKLQHGSSWCPQTTHILFHVLYCLGAHVLVLSDVGAMGIGTAGQTRVGVLR